MAYNGEAILIFIKLALQNQQKKKKGKEGEEQEEKIHYCHNLPSHLENTFPLYS